MVSKARYHVVASTGKSDKKEFLMQLGAEEVISRNDFFDTSQKSLLNAKWIAAVDNVGGNTLSTIIRSTKPHGVVTSVGWLNQIN